MTKNDVEYDFNLTPWYYDKKYNGTILRYKFSSEFYRDKFIETTLNKKYDKKLKTVGINFEISLLEDIKQYSKIEKRGFQIVTSHLTKINSIKDLKIKASFEVR